MKNKLELYKFLLEKKIVIDFSAFLLEFINETDSDINKIKNEEIIKKLYHISINGDLYLLHKKFKIIKNICDKDIFFIISKLIEDNKYMIIYKLSNTNSTLHNLTYIIFIYINDKS